MNQHLQHIASIIEQDENLSAEQKAAIAKLIKDTDKEIEITAFKLDRTEKVKRTTAILLEETIEELEQKRKAVESTNRELEIEAALERIRAVAMSMRTSEDLLNISEIMFKELKNIGFTEIRNALIGIFHDDTGFLADYDFSDFSGGSITKIPYYKNPVIDRSIKQMKIATDAFTEFIVKDKDLEEWKLFRGQNGEYEDTRLENLNELYYYFYSINAGSVGLSTFKKINEEQVGILKRFRNVFDLAYRRFIDIEKAEAQAKEAKIETGLERVRSRSLAMHNTSELQEVIYTVHKELLNLNIAINGGSFIAINKDIDDQLRCWGAGGTADTTEEVHLPLYIKPFCTNLINGIKKGPGFFTEEFTQDEKKEFFSFLFRHPPWSALGDKEKNEILSSPGGYTRSCYVNQYTSIFIINHFGRKFTENENDILQRFGKVFEQTYTRFLDLQKAEAQARESQIQLALERVRARTMAMQKSDELSETASEMFQQIQSLGLKTWSCGFNIIDKEKRLITQWVSSGDGRILPSFVTPSDEDVFKRFTQAAEKDKSLYVEEISGEALKAHYQYMASLPEVKKMLDEFQSLEITPPDFQVFHLASFSYGYLMFITYQPAPEFYDVFKRFATVFDQTYTRFLDLQKAEAQAREAEIELALERVRARTMAMQHSEELADASFLLDSQVRALGIKTWGCAFNIYGENESTEWFSSEAGTLPAYKTPRENIFLRYYEAGQMGETMHIVEFASEDCVAHYNYLCTVPVMGDALKEMIAKGGSFPTRQIDHVTYFKYGYLLFITFEPVPKAHDIFIRFAKVFEQTYTRFLDLQKAEAQAQEAQIEAALERVRSRSMAMQKSEELKEVIKVVYQQLSHLKMKLDHAGFVIDYAPKGDWHFWIADEQDIPARISHPYFDSVWATQFEEAKEKGTDFFSTILNFEEKNTFYKKLLSYIPGLPKASIDFYLSCKGLAASTVLLENVALYIENFSGVSYSDEDNKTLMRFGKVFQQTYTRFLDLEKAEAQALRAEQDLAEIKTARRKAEDALTELQVTQKQLIQSEKMASLGELTAGIAHEIQNPLNFVNNFSEVSNELIDEMKEELSKGNYDDAKEIADDVKQNLEKINHHGKRADAIVKGMLQHSRTGGAAKEPTDINKLADEYLRLAYHGLRAKEKSFNAIMKTEYDESIGSINIIPQDIGRVILNLITNAFYAVDEKKKLCQADLPDKSGQVVEAQYVPTITLSTKKINDKLEIKVTDNGNGIPEKVLGKIFQPFFTTKPTGQGTGLGLSMSYDIVKAHGGELKVETKLNEGSFFIINLPDK